MLDRKSKHSSYIWGLKLVFCLLLIAGTKIGKSEASAVTDLARSLWGAVMTTVPLDLQWRMIWVKFGESLPSFFKHNVSTNPSCVVNALVRSLMPNGELSEQQPLLFETAQAFNQEVWIGTTHREFLKTAARGGSLMVETTLSVTTCSRLQDQGIPKASFAAHDSGLNLFYPENVPCASVRMPTWLFTKRVLTEEERRQRQGAAQFTSNSVGGVGDGVRFSSLWYSPFEDVSKMTNYDGWSVGQAVDYARGGCTGYQRRALLTQREGVLVDGGINSVGFEWEDSRPLSKFSDNMRFEACLDDSWGLSCANIVLFETPNAEYIPWEDKWTFNASSRESDPKFCPDLMSRDVNEGACLSQGREAWNANFSELWTKSEDLDVEKYESRLEEECPLNLILHPGSGAIYSQFGGNLFEEEYARLLKEKARELQETVYDRIPKEGITRTTNIALFLTVVTGVQGILVAASWEITLLVANLIVRVLKKVDIEKKMINVKRLSLVVSFLFATAAILPGAFLLREEVKKTRDARVDADISFDASRRSNTEGNEFLGLIFVLTMKISDTSSRWKECAAIVAVVGFLAVLVMIWRIRELRKSSQGHLKEAFVIVEAVEP